LIAKLPKFFKDRERFAVDSSIFRKLSDKNRRRNIHSWGEILASASLG
jgi:hypothetical protein